MTESPRSTVDWERDIYARGQQLNRWPYSDLVSAMMRGTAGRARSELAVLEIGCGAGNNLWFLAAEGFRAAGIDQSPTAIAFARRRLEQHGLQAECVVGDIVTLPWAAESFDIVIDRGALTQNTHARVGSILRDVRRVLRPMGRVLSFTLFGMNHPERLKGRELEYGTYDDFRADSSFRSLGLTSFFTVDDLRRLFGAFDAVEIHTHTIRDEDGFILDEQHSVSAARPD